MKDKTALDTEAISSSASFKEALSPGGHLPGQVDDLSVTSLFLKVYGNGHHLADATGFVVVHRDHPYLITNWHVLAGRHPETGQPLDPKAVLPDQVRIAHRVRSEPDRIKWVFAREPLLDERDKPRWVEHPLGEKVDVAALKLTAFPPGVILHPLDLNLEGTDLALYPSMPVSVIGFPGGLRANVFLAIWKTGHIASDPGIHYQGLPAFLIDATTRGGMSGSIVVARASGGYMTSAGFQIGAGTRTKLLGIYASRLPKDVEIGCVWRPEAIRQVLARAPS